MTTLGVIVAILGVIFVRACVWMTFIFGALFDALCWLIVVSPVILIYWIIKKIKNKKKRKS